MSLSSQPVSMLLCWKLSVSSSLMRYSTVVLKSPLIDSSFRATTMLLEKDISCMKNWTEMVSPHAHVSVDLSSEMLSNVLTRWLLHDSPPKRSSVQIGSQQTHADLQLLRHWSSPTRFYCCGNSALAPFQSSAWSPAIRHEHHMSSSIKLTKNC